MAQIIVDPQETFWTPLAVVAQLEWWFGYSGPNHFTCTYCNGRVAVRADGSYFHSCRDHAIVGLPWEPFDPLDLIKRA